MVSLCWVIEFFVVPRGKKFKINEVALSKIFLYDDKCRTPGPTTWLS